MGDDRSQGVLLVAVFFLIISWIAVTFRVYVRAFMLKSFGWDDWTMALTLVCCALYLQIQHPSRHSIAVDPMV